MDAWFWIHMYVVFRGLCQIFLETIADVRGTKPEAMVSIKFRMPTLPALFKYVYRLRLHDLRHRRHWPMPRLVVDGTYFPPEAHVRPVVTIHGETTQDDRKALQTILKKYPGFRANISGHRNGTWMRIVALKVHCGYHNVVTELNRICRAKGALLVLTVTNDPHVESCVTMIGLHDGIKDDVDRVLATIANLRSVNF